MTDDMEFWKSQAMRRDLFRRAVEAFCKETGASPGQCKGNLRHGRDGLYWEIELKPPEQIAAEVHQRLDPNWPPF